MRKKTNWSIFVYSPDEIAYENIEDFSTRNGVLHFTDPQDGLRIAVGPGTPWHAIERDAE